MTDPDGIPARTTFGGRQKFAVAEQQPGPDVDVLVEALQAECEKLKRALSESRANDRQAMAYLNQVRELVGGDDFPDMVRRCEKLRKDAKRYIPLYEAIQRAAAELPEVWEIHLCVVRDSGSVDLIGPDGTEDFCTDNERLDYTVIDALEFAISAAKQEGN